MAATQNSNSFLLECFIHKKLVYADCTSQKYIPYMIYLDPSVTRTVADFKERIQDLFNTQTPVDVRGFGKKIMHYFANRDVVEALRLSDRVIISHAGPEFEVGVKEIFQPRSVPQEISNLVVLEEEKEIESKEPLLRQNNGVPLRETNMQPSRDLLSTPTDETSIIQESSTHHSSLIIEKKPTSVKTNYIRKHKPPLIRPHSLGIFLTDLRKNAENESSPAIADASTDCSSQNEDASQILDESFERPRKRRRHRKGRNVQPIEESVLVTPPVVLEPYTFEKAQRQQNHIRFETENDENSESIEIGMPYENVQLIVEETHEAAMDNFANNSGTPGPENGLSALLSLRANFGQPVVFKKEAMVKL